MGEGRRDRHEKSFTNQFRAGREEDEVRGRSARRRRRITGKSPAETNLVGRDAGERVGGAKESRRRLKAQGDSHKKKPCWRL